MVENSWSQPWIFTIYNFQPKLIAETVKNIFIGPYTCGNILAKINNSKTPLVWQVGTTGGQL